MNPAYNDVGTAFVAHYYAAFDADRSTLYPLYQPDSMMTFEGSPLMGQDAIVQKLVVSNLKKC